MKQPIRRLAISAGMLASITAALLAGTQLSASSATVEPGSGSCGRSTVKEIVDYDTGPIASPNANAAQIA